MNRNHPVFWLTVFLAGWIGGRAWPASEENPAWDGRKNITLGAMFQEQYRQKEGVQVIEPEGILYRVLTPGTGRTPKATDRVLVQYEGRHVDGKIFDSAEDYNTRVDRNLPGWIEVLPRMREGDRWEVVIPSHLAYGANGQMIFNRKKGQEIRIEPNETLIFVIELIQVFEPGKKSDSRSAKS